MSENQQHRHEKKHHGKGSSDKRAAHQSDDVNWRVWYLAGVLFFVSIPLGLLLWNPFTGVQYVRSRVAALEGRADLEVVAPSVLRAIFGSDIGFWSRVAGGTQIMRLNLDKSKVSNADLLFLRKTPFLKELNLANTSISDEGLSNLKYVPKLEELALLNTVVTDEGLSPLQSLKSLHSLNLDGTRVTEKVLDYLKNIPQLKTVSLHNTLITPVQLETVRATLTGVDVLPKHVPPSAPTATPSANPQSNPATK